MTIKHLLLVLGLGLSLCVLGVHAKTQSTASQIQAITNQSKLPAVLIEKLVSSEGFDLIKYLTIATDPNNNLLTTEQQAALLSIKNQIIHELKTFTASGFSVAVDPNLAFFYNNQNPTFTTVFQDNDGQTKTRTFEASIQSIGLKFQLSFNIDFIMLTDPSFNFYDSNKEIILGTGIDLGMEPFSLLYVPFLNAPGGMVMISLIAGLGGGFGIVTGGSLKPVAQTE